MLIIKVFFFSIFITHPKMRRFLVIKTNKEGFFKHLRILYNPSVWNSQLKDLKVFLLKFKKIK
jgi:hypothetical protein